MKRVLLVALFLLAATAGPAEAHEEISPSTIPTGKPVFFTLSAANEKKADLTKVVLTAPQGATFGSTTREPPGWSVDRTDTAITWSDGAVKPDHFEQWGYEIEGADQPGTLTYSVAMSFADGSSDKVDVPVTVTAPGGVPTPSASTPAKAASTTDAGAKGRADAALAVAVVAGILAVVAIAVGLARRRSSDKPAQEVAEDAQDW
jgi:uncharacterized protein YcnI